MSYSKCQKVYNKKNIQVSSVNTDLFSSRGMKIVIFHSWLSPLVTYLFLHHSMKINRQFIEKRT